MTKITKVWFDENLGEMQQEEIPSNRIWLTAEELAAAAELNGSIETTMRLTREELAERFSITMIKEPATTPEMEIWYKPNRTMPVSDHSGIWAGPGIAHTLNKSMVLADIQRAIDSLSQPMHEPLPAGLYDRMKSEGLNLDGATRLGEMRRLNLIRPRPPAAAKSRAALHPLVGALIDRLNDKN